MPETVRLETRLEELRRARLNGVDEIEVGPDRQTLIVRFVHDAPATLSPRHLRIKGEVSIPDLRVIEVRLIDADDPDLPTLAEVILNRSGDASTYELEVFGLDGFDTRYRAAPFTFYPDFEAQLDCADGGVAVAQTLPPPPLDYLAKDYAGFRQLILDRLSTTLPSWTERHIPDVGIMLVELMAYTADRLSYYQDAVATEAYLGTARRRISIRRHARLIDYAAHEGASARALVQVEPPADAEMILAPAVFLAGAPGGGLEFRPLKTARAHADLRAANATLAFHTWGNTGVVLLKGSTSATLVDLAPDRPESLRAGDFLVFETLIGGRDGIPDPDPGLRHPVRLTRVRRSRDDLLETPLLEIRWSAEDATPLDLPLDLEPGPDGRIGVARANLVLVAEGRQVAEGDFAAGVLKPVEVGPGRRRSLRLDTPGLGFAGPLGLRDSARKILQGQDPRGAAPMIDRLCSWPLDGDGKPASPAATDWTLVPDLIESGPDDPHATVEVDDDGTAILRFGDGVCGRDPAGVGFEVVYRVGVGPSGNVGAESIDGLRHPEQPDASGWRVRNPLAASGGVALEDVSQVRLLAPTAFKDRLERAVTADDYAALARELEPEVQNAACALVRSGARWLARVAIDPLGTDQEDDDLVDRVASALAPYRHIGHDVEVVQGLYAPLLLVMRIVVAPGFVRGHVRRDLLITLGSGLTADGVSAPFNPDRLTFGTVIAGGPLIAAARAVAGVIDARIVRLARLFDPERGAYENGVLAMSWNEIPRLDNDPLRPDRGRLELRLEGGLP